MSNNNSLILKAIRCPFWAYTLLYLFILSKNCQGWLYETVNKDQMNEIYKGRNLSIHYKAEESLFIQKWIISPRTVSDFKAEMIAYTKMYKKYKPSNTLWLQQNFTLNIEDETNKWIEENVNKPCLSYRNKKCAFVVSKDVLAHITVMDSFDKVQSCIKPKHFASELEARKWLNGELIKNKNQTKKAEITFNGIDKDENAVIEFKASALDISDTIKFFKSILQENELNISK